MSHAQSCYIKTSQSGGYVKKVKVYWRTGGNLGVKLYGKDSAFSNINDGGTELATLYGGSNNECIVSGNYPFISITTFSDSSGAYFGCFGMIQIYWNDSPTN